MQPSALPQLRFEISATLRSAFGFHTAATRIPTRTSSTGTSTRSWRFMVAFPPSSITDARTNGSVSCWP